jgi:hypothetical protein
MQHTSLQMLLVEVEVEVLSMDQHQHNMVVLVVLEVVVDWFQVVLLQQAVQEHQDKVMLAGVLNIVQVQLLVEVVAVAQVVLVYPQLLRVLTAV